MTQEFQMVREAQAADPSPRRLRSGLNAMNVRMFVHPGSGARAGGSAKRWLPHIFHPSFHDRQFEEWQNDAVPRTS